MLAHLERRTSRRFDRWEILPAIVVLAVVAVLAARALDDPSTRDAGYFYNGAKFAVEDGNPWRELAWLQLPAVILVLAPVTQVLTESATAWFMTLLNLVVALGLAAWAFWWLSARCARWLTWLVVVALVLWAPLAGTFWWKQLNLLVLALALAGFVLAPRRPWAAGALMGFSIALKPLVAFLPLFLLVRRDTRKSAIATVAAAALVTIGGLLVMAAGGGSADPVAYYREFDDRGFNWYCTPSNASPTGLACRIMGEETYGVTRVLVSAAVVLLVALAIGLLRGTSSGSLEVFAWAALLSPMVGPVTWPHYGVMLAPMFLVLIARAWEWGSRVEVWAGLAMAYALSQIAWSPARSAIGQLSPGPEPLDQVFRTFAAASMAPFVLLAVALAVGGTTVALHGDATGPAAAASRTRSSGEQCDGRGEAVEEVPAADGPDLAGAQPTSER